MKLEENKFLLQVEREGYKYSIALKSIFVPFPFEERDMSHSMIQLREKYGYAIQTEIV